MSKKESNSIDEFLKVQKDNFELFKKKNKDYGDSFNDFGVIGILIRNFDKLNRLINVSKNCVNYVKDESLRDTLIDISNYAVMGVMLIDREKKSN